MKRLRSFGPELLIILGGLLFALLSRGRHANVTEDHGFWFSAAQSLVNGGRVMHDVRIQWGPGTLWILEAVGRFFGMRVSSFVVFQFVVGLLAVVGIQVFARRFLSLIERWICAAILVALILWMVGPGNLLYPCAFAMSHALLLAVATLLVSDFCLRHGRPMTAAIAGVLAAAAFLTKQEFGVAAAAGIFCLTALDPRLRAAEKARSLAVAGVLFFCVYFGVIGLLLHGQTFRQFVASNILWPWASVPGPWQGLYKRVLGLDEPGRRLVEAANALIDIAAFGGTTWAVLYFKDLAARSRMALAAALVVVWGLWWWRWTEGSHFLPMTLVLPAIIGATSLPLLRLALGARVSPLPAGEVAAKRRVFLPLPAGEAGTPQADRVREIRGPWLPHPAPLPPGEGDETGSGFPGPFFALAAGAFVLLQREGYRGNIEAYYSGMGYVLAVPVAVPLIWWAIRGPRTPGRRSLIAAGLLLTLVARFGAGRLRTLESGWNRTTPITTERGTVYVANDLAPVLSSTADFLRANTSRGDPILMMPQTYGLDFLLDRKSLLYFIWISPGYLTDERELIARLERTPPKAAVIFEGSFGVFHSGQFGQGFADSLVGWIEKSLPRQERFGQGTPLPGRRFLP